MSDEICGHPTADGTPCQHPTTDDGDPDRCYIDAHNDADTDSGDPGRPSKFNDERARAAVAAAKQSKSLGGCARAAGVDRTALTERWLEKDDLEFVDETGQERDFVTAFTQARADGETILVQGGLRNDNVDTSMAKFLLATSFDYEKVEKREHSGPGGGPIELDRLDEREKTQLDEAFNTEPDT